MRKLLTTLAALTMVAAPASAQSVDRFYPLVEAFARSACNNAYNGNSGKTSAAYGAAEAFILNGSLTSELGKLPKSQKRDVDKMVIRALDNRCGTYSIPIIYAMGIAPLAREMGYQL